MIINNPVAMSTEPPTGILFSQLTSRLKNHDGALRIAILTHSFPPTVGGKEQATYELVKRLQRIGHLVQVYVGQRPNGSLREENLDGARVHRLSSTRLFIVRRFVLHRWLQYTARFVSLFFKLILHRVRSPWDVIHVDFTPDLGLSTLLICRVTRTPFVVTAYGSDLLLLSGEPAYKTWIAKGLLSRAAHVTTVSRNLRDVAVNLVPKVKDYIDVIHVGVDIRFFNQCEELPTLLDPPYILTVGRMEFVKGRDLLVRAFTKIHALHPEYRLVLTGDGATSQTIRTLTDELGISSHVIFWGTASRTEIARLLHGCDLHVLPSRSEGMPLAMIEGFACSKPIVASRVGGVGEIVEDGRTGILVESENVEELANAIIYLLENIPIRSLMGRRAYKVALDHDWEKVASSYDLVYQKARLSL